MEKEKTATNAGTLLTDHVPLATGICSLCPPGIPQIPPFHNDLSPQGSAQSLPIYLLTYYGVKTEEGCLSISKWFSITILRYAVNESLMSQS